MCFLWSLDWLAPSSSDNPERHGNHCQHWGRLAGGSSADKPNQSALAVSLATWPITDRYRVQRVAATLLVTTVVLVAGCGPGQVGRAVVARTFSSLATLSSGQPTTRTFWQPLSAVAAGRQAGR
jgi:hypothetical protein